MSRLPFIAGNWKMNKNPEETKAFVEAIAGKLPSADKVEAGIAAPAVDLSALLSAAEGTGLKVEKRRERYRIASCSSKLLL